MLDACSLLCTGCLIGPKDGSLDHQPNPIVSLNHRSNCFGLQIGPVKVGSQHKIALQTMTTTDTRDVNGTVDQVLFLSLTTQKYELPLVESTRAFSFLKQCALSKKTYAYASTYKDAADRWLESRHSRHIRHAMLTSHQKGRAKQGRRMR